MSILFIILKIVGIILLVIFAVILFLLLMLLFHPVFYSASGWMDEEIRISGHVTWLFGIFWISYHVLDKELHYALRLLGIPIIRRPSQKKKTPVTSDDVLDEAEALDDVLDEAEALDEAAQAGTNGTSSKDDEIGQTKKQRHKQNFRRQKNKPKTENRFITMLQRIKQEWQDERNRSAFAHIFREMKYLLHHIKPNKIRANLTFSTGDPALTGQMLGVVSLFPQVYQYKLHIYPDFMADEWYIRGTFQMRGHIMLIYPCISLLRMLKDKNIKRLMNKIRN